MVKYNLRSKTDSINGQEDMMNGVSGGKQKIERRGRKRTKPQGTPKKKLKGGEETVPVVIESDDSDKESHGGEETVPVAIESDDPDKERHGRSKSETKSDMSSAGDDEWVEHPSSLTETGFHNFEKGRRRDCFSKGQIWGIYDEYGMPRRYVQVDKISSSPNSVFVTFLKHSGSSRPNDKRITKETGWRRPVCGIFYPNFKGLQVSRHAFSHKVYHQSFRRKSRTDQSIYPQKGDVWAVYKNAEVMLTPRMQKYQLVEVLTDYRKDRGVKVVYLVKYDEGGYRSIFQRLARNGVEVTLQIKKNQLDRLSHQVPSFRIEGESNTLLNGCFELDPSSLPLSIDELEDELEPKLDNKCLLLKFIDYKSLLMKELFKDNMIWATYDDRDGLPRSYVVIESSMNGREGISWLEPCPATEDEKRWYKAGWPIACGNFRLKKTTLSQDYSMFSHPMPYEWDNSSKQFKIYPRKGEVWAIYRDWGSELRRNMEGFKFEYDYIEFLDDFNKSEVVNALYLVKVDGFYCLFQRQKNESGVEIPFIASGSDLYRFSHRVLGCKIEEHGFGFIKEPVLLDPLVVCLHAGEDPNLLLGHPKETDIETDKKECNKFIAGQIWALYNDAERMIPRSYAIINQVLPDELKVEVMMLKPHPVYEEEMEWVDKNLPIACGTFRVGKVTSIKEMSEFSHLVSSPCEEGKRQTSFYNIIPKRGEVWAIYEDDIIETKYNSEEPPGYQMVEILSCFDDISGMNVASLISMEGPEMVFRRQTQGGFDLVKTYSRKELVQFSHRVLQSRVVGG